MKMILSAALLLVAGFLVWADDPAGDPLTIEFLQSLQTKNGGFANADKSPAPTLRATSAAVRGLDALGAKPKNVAAVKKFVAQCFDADSGGFADTPGGKTDVSLTAVGLMAIKALELPQDTCVPAAEKYFAANVKSFEDIRIAVAGLEAVGAKSSKGKDWLVEIMKLRNPDGTFGKEFGQARDTGGSVVILLRMGETVDNREAILKALRDGQRPNGGFGKAESEFDADLETSYRVMRCFHMMKEKPGRVEALRTFVAKCRNEDGGYALTPGESSTVGATYFAATIKKWLE